MNGHTVRENFICIVLGIVMLIASVYFVDTEIGNGIQKTQQPVMASLEAPEVSRNAQYTAEELSGLSETGEVLDETKRYLQKNVLIYGLAEVYVICFLTRGCFFPDRQKWLYMFSHAEGRRRIVRYIHQQDGRKH